MLDGRWRAGFERGVAPVGRVLQRAGITADALTVVGLAVSAVTAVLVASGHLVWAVVGLVLTGVPDLLDGTVARHTGRAGPRGAFFDSVADRVSDALLLGGVAWYLEGRDGHGAVLALAVLAASMLVSYERAKAESLGFTARGGLMERAERLVVLGVGLAFDVVVPVLWLMLALTLLTAVHRFVKVWRQAPAPAGAERTPRLRRARAHGAGGRPRPSLVQWWEARRPSARTRARDVPRRARRSRP